MSEQPSMKMVEVAYLEWTAERMAALEARLAAVKQELKAQRALCVPGGVTESILDSVLAAAEEQGE